MVSDGLKVTVFPVTVLGNSESSTEVAGGEVSVFPEVIV